MGASRPSTGQEHRMTITREPLVPMVELSAALDEIYRLRRAMAYEAAVSSDSLYYATLPKTIRRATRAQVDRMRAAANGYTASAYKPIGDATLRGALRDAGAPETLTRAAFVEEIFR
jgi:hypothetical protein